MGRGNAILGRKKQTLMFTNEELNTLIQLLDLATKAGGLGVAQQALPLALKIQQQLQPVDVPATEE